MSYRRCPSARSWLSGASLLGGLLALLLGSIGCGGGGSACSVVDNGDGTATISCDDGTSVDISNGTDGVAGTNGTNGTNGTAGTNGIDGTSCTITDNLDGTSTIACSDGTTALVENGASGAPGGNVEITSLHGTDYLLSSGEYATAGKELVIATITGATADASGVVVVNFSVERGDASPVINVPSINANITQLVPGGTGDVFSKRVAYITRTETVSGTTYPQPDGTTETQAYRENNGTLVNHGDGTYTYTFATNLSTVAGVTYDRSLTHRVYIMMGGHSGPTADAYLDFVPDGSGAPETRDIVVTATCKGCHGPEFHGHGGDRLSVEGCVTCHLPGSIDAQSGNTLDLKVMLHKIHAGGELASIPGPDGIVWDNPSTGTDESADNGSYAIYGYRNSKHEWWKAEFPAVLSNCEKCHTGGGADVAAWMDVPSRDACGSCHDNIWFGAAGSLPAGMLMHSGGAQTTDTNCLSCHAGGFAPTVAQAHDWMARWSDDSDHGDLRNVPEFIANLSVSGDGGDGKFDSGETPLVTLVITDPLGNPIDHTTVLKDTTKESCLAGVAANCPGGDGNFDRIYLMVHGPRGGRNPVLTSAARADVISTDADATFDLAGETLDVIIDGGQDLMSSASGGSVLPGTCTLTLPTTAGVAAAVVAAELNANACLAARAIAYVDEGTGNLAIRSRNLGRLYSIQVGGTATTALSLDTLQHVPGGFYPSNDLTIHADPALDDPKAQWFTDRIEYTLDPVDDLQPGTYVASVELGDMGRTSATNYRTPTVAKLAFQVGTTTEELAPAANCSNCHQAIGAAVSATAPHGFSGFVLDFARHYKMFDATAVDQCGACHDYQPQNATGSGWSGARPISKRVHAVHNGSNLNYPLLTVDYSNGDPVAGRNWDITFPQDVRHCQSCHEDGTTSGSWATEASRLPCMGCHDADAATTHMTLMTYDPTPANPWSGDEEESCKTCH